MHHIQEMVLYLYCNSKQHKLKTIQMKQTKSKIQLSFEKKRELINDEAEQYVLREIEKVCKENKWSFKSLCGVTVKDVSDEKIKDANNGQELSDTVLHKLVYWYEDYFGGFYFLSVSFEWFLIY